MLKKIESIFLPTIIWVGILFIVWYGKIVTCIIPLEIMRTWVLVLYEVILVILLFFVIDIRYYDNGIMYMLSGLRKILSRTHGKHRAYNYKYNRKQDYHSLFKFDKTELIENTEARYLKGLVKSSEEYEFYYKKFRDEIKPWLIKGIVKHGCFGETEIIEKGGKKYVRMIFTNLTTSSKQVGHPIYESGVSVVPGMKNQNYVKKMLVFDIEGKDINKVCKDFDGKISNEEGYNYIKDLLGRMKGQKVSKINLNLGIDGRRFGNGELEYEDEFGVTEDLMKRATIKELEEIAIKKIID